MKEGQKKFIKLREVVKAAKKERRKGKKIVTSNGCFDILHIGHVRNLSKAKSLGDVLIVGINSDRSVKLNKGKDRPIVKEKERAEIVGALEVVDYVFVFDTKTPIEWISKVKPDFHVKGSDRRLDQMPEREVVEKFGGKVIRIPLVKDRSTTSIISKIKKLG